ncbi:hypothetical protein V8G54_005196 [Vigna mungo]|uniref:Uncharacterized protein n=1 Tax=Vigna mungo TaxID=3915 RepID=A0AAQ3PFJ4_VIGMU
MDMKIVNAKSSRKAISKEELSVSRMVEKVLRSLTKDFESVIWAIEESKDLTMLSVEELTEETMFEPLDQALQVKHDLKGSAWNIQEAEDKEIIVELISKTIRSKHNHNTNNENTVGRRERRRRISLLKKCQAAKLEPECRVVKLETILHSSCSNSRRLDSELHSSCVESMRLDVELHPSCETSRKLGVEFNPSCMMTRRLERSGVEHKKIKQVCWKAKRARTNGEPRQPKKVLRELVPDLVGDFSKELDGDLGSLGREFNEEHCGEFICELSGELKRLSWSSKRVEELKLNIRDQGYEIDTIQYGLRLKEEQVEKIRLKWRRIVRMLHFFTLSLGERETAKWNEIMNKQRVELEELKKAVEDKDEETSSASIALLTKAYMQSTASSNDRIDPRHNLLCSGEAFLSLVVQGPSRVGASASIALTVAHGPFFFSIALFFISFFSGSDTVSHREGRSARPRLRGVTVPIRGGGSSGVSRIRVSILGIYGIDNTVVGGGSHLRRGSSLAQQRSDKDAMMAQHWYVRVSFGDFWVLCARMRLVIFGDLALLLAHAAQGSASPHHSTRISMLNHMIKRVGFTKCLSNDTNPTVFLMESSSIAFWNLRQVRSEHSKMRKGVPSFVSSWTNCPNWDNYNWLYNRVGVSAMVGEAIRCGGTLTQEQMNELAHGLELSKHKFLWVVRASSDEANVGYLGGEKDVDPLEFLPSGFLERTKKQAMLHVSVLKVHQIVEFEILPRFRRNPGEILPLFALVHNRGKKTYLFLPRLYMSRLQNRYL